MRFERRIVNEMKSWVIFDADNTLWDVESLYDNARDLFCRYVEGVIGSRTNGDGTMNNVISEKQRSLDLELQKTFGYSANRFAQSFEATLLFFLPAATAEQIKHVRGLAESVFQQDASLFEGLEATINYLCSHYNLGIITSGERWVQEKRLFAFPLRDRFSAVKVVNVKTRQVFDEFCSAQNVHKDSSWVVGDSLRSDILPATDAGLRAIHFDVPNWAHETADKPAGIRVARSMTEVLVIISEDLRSSTSA